MSEDIFAALFGAFSAEAAKFYAFLDQKGNLVATGSTTDLEYAQQVEIDEAGHKLCLEKGLSVLELRDGKIEVKEAEVDRTNKLVYINRDYSRASVIIKVKDKTASAKLTKTGLVELASYASKGKVTGKIWLLDADHLHRCVAELKIGSDFIMDSVKLEYIPKRIIAATYPIFNYYSLETE